MNSPLFRYLRPDKTVESNNPADYAIHSQYNSIKIFDDQVGTVTVSPIPPFGGSPDTKYVDIEHNLGYKPTIFAFMSPEDAGISGGFYQLPVPLIPGATYGTYKGYITHVDDNIARLVLIGTLTLGAPDQDINYKYRVCKDPREEAWYE